MKSIYIESIRDMIAISKAAFEAMSSGLWLGVAMVIFNNYAIVQFPDLLFKRIDYWMFTCIFVSMIYYSIVKIKELRKK